MGDVVPERVWLWGVDGLRRMICDHLDLPTLARVVVASREAADEQCWRGGRCRTIRDARRLERPSPEERALVHLGRAAEEELVMRAGQLVTTFSPGLAYAHSLRHLALGGRVRRARCRCDFGDVQSWLKRARFSASCPRERALLNALRPRTAFEYRADNLPRGDEPALRCEKIVVTATVDDAAGVVLYLEFVSAVEEDDDAAYLGYPGTTIWDAPHPPYATTFRNHEACFKLGFSDRSASPKKLVALRHYNFLGAPAIERLAGGGGAPPAATFYGVAEDTASWQRSATLSHIGEFVSLLERYDVSCDGAPALPEVPGADFVVGLCRTLARSFPRRRPFRDRRLRLSHAA